MKASVRKPAQLDRLKDYNRPEFTPKTIMCCLFSTLWLQQAKTATLFPSHKRLLVLLFFMWTFINLLLRQWYNKTLYS